MALLLMTGCLISASSQYYPRDCLSSDSTVELHVDSTDRVETEIRRETVRRGIPVGLHLAQSQHFQSLHLSIFPSFLLFARLDAAVFLAVNCWCSACIGSSKLNRPLSLPDSSIPRPARSHRGWCFAPIPRPRSARTTPALARTESQHPAGSFIRSICLDGVFLPNRPQSSCAFDPILGFILTPRAQGPVNDARPLCATRPHLVTDDI